MAQRQGAAAKALERAIDASFSRQLSTTGAAVSVLDIGPMTRMAREAIARGTAIDEAVNAAIGRYRVRA